MSDLVGAVDRGDLANARTLLDRGADPDAEDADGNSALMLAVWHGDADLVGRMLAKHADPNHANQLGTTALHWAIDDAAKTKLLLDAGARANAEDRSGTTPLELAVGRDGDAAVVTLLIAHGADARPAGARIGASDPATAKLLLAHGADPRAEGALQLAAARGNTETLQLLLDHGAPIDAPATLGMTPLMWAAQMGHADAVVLLLLRGADPDRVETFNRSTALIQAASSERADATIVQAQLNAHASTALVDDEGASALEWAIRRGDPDIIQLIAARETAPRPIHARVPHGQLAPAATPRAAVERAIPLLEQARPAWRRAAGCPSCHHDALPAFALEHALHHGLAIDTGARAREAAATAAFFERPRDKFREGVGFADVVECAYLLAGLAASDYPADATTAAMARYLELHQAGDGRVPAMMQREPADGSDVALTAIAIRALSTYAPDPARIARARTYLAGVTAATTEDRVYQLLGLRWTGAQTGELALLAAKLVETQRDDGGFAQLAGLRSSDPYATGQAIVALREAAGLPASDPAIQRAVKFLLAHQYKDGSWFVATRALRFQPFIVSGFPHGRSQFSSIAGTAWAVMALTDTL
jgi:ankyrin repeat protein